MTTKTASATRAGAASGSLATATPKPEKPRISSAKTSTGTNVEIRLTTDDFHKMGGSEVDDFNQTILCQALSTIWDSKLWYSKSEEANLNSQPAAAVMAAMAAFKPKDEIEGMLAAQAVAMHFAAIECFRRSMLWALAGDNASKLRNDGANLARCMTEMLEALDRKRGKGP